MLNATGPRRVLYEQWNAPAGNRDTSVLLIKWSENQSQGHPTTGARKCSPAVCWAGCVSWRYLRRALMSIPFTTVTCLLPLVYKELYTQPPLPCSLLSTQCLGQSLTCSSCSRWAVCPLDVCLPKAHACVDGPWWWCVFSVLLHPRDVGLGFLGLS